MGTGMKMRMRYVVAAVTAVAAAGLTIPAFAATAGPVTGLGGKCLDVAGSVSANGAKVQLYDCNGTGAQQWTIGDDGTIRALGKCLDVAGGTNANGIKVQLW